MSRRFAALEGWMVRGMAAALLSLVALHCLVSAARATDRVGVVLTDGRLQVKSGDDPASTDWRTLDTNAIDVAMGGNRILRRDALGQVLATAAVSEVPGWTPVSAPGNTGMAVDQFPPRIGMVSAGRVDAVDNGLFTVDGDLTLAATLQLGSSQGVVKVAAADNRMAAVLSNRKLFVKDGQYGAWIFEIDGAVDIALTGQRIIVLLDNGELWGKEGPLTAPWKKLTDSPVVKMAADGDRVAATVANGDLWLSDGPLGNVSNWVFEAHNVTAVALSGDRVGIIRSNGDLLTSDGPPGSSWILGLGGVQRLALAPGRIGAVLANHQFFVMEGSQTSTWTLLNSQTSNIAMAGSRIVRLATDGAVYEKDGAITSPWTYVSGQGSSQAAVDGSSTERVVMVRDQAMYSFERPALAWAWQHGAGIKTAVADGRVATILSNKKLYVKEGGPGSSWVFEIDGATDVALTGRRIVVLLDNGELWGKEGTLSSQWVRLSYSPVTKMAASGDRVVAIVANGDLWGAQGALASGLSSGWQLMVGHAVDVVMDGNRTGVLLDNHDFFVMKGAMNSTWVRQQAGNAAKIALSHTDTTSPQLSIADIGLWAARNQPVLTDATINVNVTDDDSGAKTFTLYERRSDGSLQQISRQSREVSNCPGWWCAGTSLGFQQGLDPVVLGWTTGTHHLVAIAEDFAGNSQRVEWDVTYYATSWIHGGSDHVVNTPAEINAVAAIIDVSADKAVADALVAGLAPADRNPVLQVLWQPEPAPEEDADLSVFAGLDIRDVIEQSQSGIKAGRFYVGGDSPHLSSTSTTPAMHAHGWWKKGRTSFGTWADVTVQLQQKRSNGNWVDVGDVGTGRVKSGGASRQRVTAHAECASYPGRRYTYRSKIDVDIVSYFDEPDKKYFDMQSGLPIEHYECSALGINP